MIVNKKKTGIRIVVQCALLIALAVVVRNLSYMVYFGGAPGMRIGFSGVFTKLVAILFGPMFGGIASGVVDIIGYLLKPEGAYIPWLTVTAVCGGIITGLLWIVFKKWDDTKLRRFFLPFFIVCGVAGGVNHISIINMNNWGQILNGIGKSRDFVSVGLEAVSVIGLIFILAHGLVNRISKNKGTHDDFLKIILAAGISGIIVSTINTYILKAFIPGLDKLAFAAFWIPRLIQELLMTVIQTYLVSLLLFIYRKYIAK